MYCCVIFINSLILLIFCTLRSLYYKKFILKMKSLLSITRFTLLNIVKRL